MRPAKTPKKEKAEVGKGQNLEKRPEVEKKGGCANILPHALSVLCVTPEVRLPKSWSAIR
jgi:hypothetical protein